MNNIAFQTYKERVRGIFTRKLCEICGCPIKSHPIVADLPDGSAFACNKYTYHYENR